MTIDQGVNNILSVYNNAWEGEIEHGILWYKKARAFCREQAQEHNLSLDIVIAVLSALSPRNKWENNLKDCVNVLRAAMANKKPHTIKCSTFNRNKEKAFAIVKERKPSLVKMSNKTAAFFDNIKRVNSDSVTVDVHAYSIFHGTTIQARGIKDGEYKAVSRAYAIAAAKVGLRPYEMQAITWVTWRRMLKVGTQLPMEFAEDTLAKLNAA